MHDRLSGAIKVVLEWVDSGGREHDHEFPARNEILPGQRVRIVEKQNQRTGVHTDGAVERS